MALVLLSFKAESNPDYGSSKLVRGVAQRCFHGFTEALQGCD